MTARTRLNGLFAGADEVGEVREGAGVEGDEATAGTDTPESMTP